MSKWQLKDVIMVGIVSLVFGVVYLGRSLGGFTQHLVNSIWPRHSSE